MKEDKGYQDKLRGKKCRKDVNFKSVTVDEEIRQELKNLGKERGELQNKLEFTDGIISDLNVEVDDLNMLLMKSHNNII